MPEYQLTKEYLDTKMEVLDEKTDIAYLPDGTTVHRLYNNPRLLYQDGEELKVQDEDWSLFNEMTDTQLTPQDEAGYEYEIPTEDTLENTDTVVVRTGVFQKGEEVIEPQTAQFEQTQEDNVTVTRYTDVYPGVDTVFRDSGFKRDREIIIKEPLKNITPSDTLLFWEEYEIPEGAKVVAGDGTVVTGTHKQGMEPVNIKSADGVNVHISGSMMFDGTIEHRDELDLSPDVLLGLDEIIEVKGNTLRIGLEVPASYLLDTNRVYPVIIDPTYYACREGNGDGLGDPEGLIRACSITDFYLRARNGDPDNTVNLPPSVDNGDLFVGLWVNGQNFTRHSVMYFNTNFVNLQGTVRSASLKMYYRNIGNGVAPGTDLEVKRIDRDWDRNGTGQYVYNDFRNRVVEENPTRRVNANPINVWHSFNVTNSVVAWKNGFANHGLMLEQDPPWAQGGALGGGADNRLLKFDSSTGNNPYLEIVMDPPPPLQRADLTSDGSVVPNTIRPGERLDFSNTVINNGNARSALSEVRYYWGSVRDYSRPHFTTAQFQALNVGQSVQLNNSFVVPANTEPGDYYLYYSIDAANTVVESNENNNNFNQSVTVLQNLQPDLRGENVTVDDNSVLPNEEVTFSLDIYNRGTGTSNGAAEVHYYFNRDSASYAANRKVGEDSFPQLNVNARSFESFNFTIPAGTAPGTYYLSYFVDAETLVGESNENNNQGFVQITIQGGRDLEPQNFVINNPRAMLSGDRIEVTGTVNNSGNLATNWPNYEIAIRDVDSGALYILEAINPATLPIFDPGQSRQVTLSGTIPGNIPLSDWYSVQINVDSNRNFAETNENNNITQSSNIVRIERNGYCGGCTGGGNAPPPQQQGLLDTDGDGRPDVVEGFFGTNVNGGQVSPIGDPSANVRAPTPVDRKMEVYGGDPVNIRTGGFELTQQDFTLAGRGIPIDITRVYNSRIIDNNNRLGAGWNISTASFYYQDLLTNNVTAYLGESLVASFTTNDGGNTFVTPDGMDDTLSRVNNLIQYKTLDGYTYVFSRYLTTNIGLLERVIDPNGNTNTFTYIFRRDIPLLSTVTDPSGRQLQVMYGAADDTNLWDKVVEIRSNLDENTPTIVQYTYKDNAGQLLEQVKQMRYYQGVPEELVSNFKYDNNRLSEYTDPRGTILYNAYDAEGRVTQQREFNPRIDAPGASRPIFDFEYIGPDADIPGSTSCTNLVSYRTNNTTYSEKTCFNADGLKLGVKNGVGNVSRYTYDANGMVLTARDAAGNVTSYQYDNRRRTTREIPPDTSAWHTEITYEYQNSFNRLTRKTETVTSLLNPNAPPIVRQTQYAIDAANGNVTAITDPTGARQQFEYGQFGNVRTTIDKNNNRTTYTYDPTGNYVATESITVTQADGAQQVIAKSYGYDAYGNKTSVTTGRNQTYTYAFDTHHNVRLATDPLARQTRYEYDLENHLIREVAPLNRVTEYVYDADTNESLLTMRRLGENNTSIAKSKTYDSVGNLTADLDALNNATRYTYNAANRLTSVESPTNTVTYSYFPHGLKESESDTANQRKEYEYDARGNVTAITQFNTNNEQSITRFEYDGLDRQVAVVDPNGNRTEILYDLMDRPLRKIDAQSNITEFVYDANGNKRTETNPRDFATNYTYDGLNRLIKSTNAQNLDTLLFYDEDGNVVRTIDRQNQNGANNTHVTRYVYDQVGRKITEIDALNSEVRYTYDVGNRLQTTTDKVGRTTTFTYDLFDRLLTEQDPAQNTTQYTYDANGNRTVVTFPDQTRVQYEYDASNRLRFITDPDGNRREYRYNAANSKTAEIDKNGRNTSFAYDRGQRLTSETNAEGTVTNYTYDLNGNRRVSNTAGKTTEFIYDSLNRAERIVHPGNKTENFTFDENGNTLTRTDGNGEVIAFEYDSLDRVREKDLPGNETVTYTYDNWGNLLTVNDPAATESYEYDRLNRVIGEAHTIDDLENQTFNIEREYFRDGQLQSITDAADRTVGYAYDNRGLLQTVNYNNRALVTYGYNSSDLPTSATFQNGITTTYQYDNRHRLTNLTTRNPQQQLLTNGYQYDRESNRTQLTENTALDGVTSNRTVNYGYDVLEQLTTVNYSDVPGNTDLRFNYDSWGNRQSLTTPAQSASYSYAANSQELTSYSLNSRLRVDASYDGNGSVTQEVHRRLGRQTKAVSYEWDSRQRLSEISYQDAAAIPALPAPTANTLQFAYNDAGNRIKKAVSGAEATYYVNAGLDVLNELDARGDVTKTIVQGLSQVAEIDSQGRITFVHGDVLGSAMFVSDEAGAVVEQYDYDPFGSLMGSLGDPNRGTRYKFTGQEYDSESDLGYFNARYYNPLIGRFISRDSYMGGTGDTISRNRYNYVKNNPLKYVDPTGNMEKKKLVACNCSTDVMYVSVQSTPKMQIASWYGDAWNTTKDWTVAGVQTAGGVVVGAGEGLWDTAKFVGNAVVHPIETGKGIVKSTYELGKSGIQLGKDIYNDPGQVWDNTVTGIGAGYDAFMAQSPYERGKDGGYVIEKIAEAVLLKKAGTSSKTVTTGTTGSKVTVIGETMDRVQEAASQIPGAKTLNNMPDFPGQPWQVTSQMMQYNRQWIFNELKSGSSIIDIGYDMARKAPSIFYEMEQNMIKNYQKLHPEWDNLIKK
ncbi:hypothetical protein KBD59_03330 [Candidatus Gracilibacteria bacterium]|nr:hypothetical protein [Candidatus Gracilibacteria bacterium]